MNVEIANRLQMLRKKNGYSQEELAERIGISRQAVSKWERAEASPDTDNLILLAKLYGVTLDELLRTDNAMPNSEGISLRKEDYEYVGSKPDDGEIYPNGRGSFQEAEHGQHYNETNYSTGEVHGYYNAKPADDTAKTNSSDPGELIKNVADFTINVTKQAINTAAKAISEADEKMKSGEGLEKSVGESFEKNFEGFGKRVDDFGEKVAKKFDSLGREIDRKFDDFSKEADKKFYNQNHKNNNQKATENSKKKYPVLLLDKLFPLIIVCIFLLFVSWDLAHPMWIIFLFIPVYYIFRRAFNRYRAGEISASKAIINFIDGALPVGVVFIFLALGFLTELWDILWTIFFIIPLWYTGKEAVKKHNLMIFCYPVVAVWAFCVFAILFDSSFGLVFIATIPFYYIIIDHYRKKEK